MSVFGFYLPLHRRTRRRTRTGLAVLALLVGAVVAPLGARAAVLPGPSALAPNADAGSAAAVSDVLLTWSPVPGAVSYEIQVSDSSGFDPYVLAGTSSRATWALPAAVPAGDYVWRVRALAAKGVGDWSAPASFTHGWDNAPANLRVVSSVGVPSVAWDAIPGASFYEVEYSTTPYSDTDPTVMQAKTDANRFTCFTQHPFLAPYGTATGTEKLPGDEKTCTFAGGSEDPRVTAIHTAWADCDKAYRKGVDDENHAAATATPPRAADVTALDAALLLCKNEAVKAQVNVDPMSFARFFPLKAAPVYTPGVQPVDPATNADLPWYVRVRGRNGSVDATKSPFAAPAISCTGVWHTAGGVKDPATGAVTVPVPSAVPSYLAVPECSTWSAPIGFYVTGGGWARSLAGVAVTGARIQTGSTLTPSTPIFSWQPVAGAAKYRVYLSRTRDLRSADHVWETMSSNGLAPYGTLPDARRLYWGVQACGWETCGPVGTVLSFTKTASSAVAAQQVDATPVDVAFAWHTQGAGDDSEATSYQVQADLVGTSWTKPALDVTVDAARAAGETTEVSRTTVPLAGLGDGTYVWRVRAVDESGFGYPWSTGMTFLRDVSAPKASITTKSGFAQGAPLTVSFTEPVTGVALSVTANGVRVAGTITGSGTAAWTFTPRSPWVTAQAYTVAVTGARDGGGNVAPPVTASLRTAGLADAGTVALAPSPRVAKLWRARSASDAVGKSYLFTLQRAALSTRVAGTKVALYACRSPPKRSGARLDRRQRHRDARPLPRLQQLRPGLVHADLRRRPRRHGHGARRQGQPALDRHARRRGRDPRQLTPRTCSDIGAQLVSPATARSASS